MPVQQLRMRLLGLALLAVGSAIVVYSVIYDSASTGFWSLYTGMILITTGLGFLGMNAGVPF